MDSLFFFSFHNNYYSLVLSYLQSTSLQQTSLSDTHLRTRSFNYFNHYGLVAEGHIVPPLGGPQLEIAESEADVKCNQKRAFLTHVLRISARTALGPKADPTVIFNCKGFLVILT